MGGWPALAALVLSAALPLLAQGASGKEVIAIFRTQCVEPFPSVEEIAAAALRLGYEEQPLKIEDVFGSNAPFPVPEAYVASVVGFDARSFSPPIGSGSKPMITVISIERIEAGDGQVVEKQCIVSDVKANEGLAKLEAGADGIARVLEDRFGYPFEWKRQGTHETDELSSGRIDWWPETGDDHSGVSASLHYVEVEPRNGWADGSIWFLAVKLRETRS